jgi:PAS domain S-box-containing protein
VLFRSSEAPEQLQALLGWRDGAVRADLVRGVPQVRTQADFTAADGRVVRLSARLRSYGTCDGRQRFMAVVEDRSAEAERDLAQLEMEALMSAAGVGVATFDSSLVWHHAAQPGVQVDPSEPGPAVPGLDPIHSRMIDPGSRPAYERLTQALRDGRPAEARYAVRDSQRGLRWLHSRIEPAQLQSGREGTSVVTLDVTEQELARQRSEELLRELTTILDGSPVGIAYLRDGRLVRCNRRFERMLGFDPGAAAGAAFEPLFAVVGRSDTGIALASQAVAEGRACDVEMTVGLPDAAPGWYALSVRRAESAHAGAEAVAVLTDISGLKRQQVETERALHERELMFNQSDVGMAWLRGGRILRTNPAMSDLTGLTPAELVGLEAAQLYEDPGVARELDATARRALAAFGRHASERRLRRRDGSPRWVQVAMRVVDSEDPESDIIGSFVDVDERQRARESLQQQAVRMRAVLDSVLVGIVTVGDQGIEWMNRSARRMFAGELGEFAGEPIATVATQEPDHPLRRTDWLQRLADGQAENFECRLMARDGRAFWVVGNAMATSHDGAGRQVTFALLDIETRRQAEVRISTARASLQRLIETAPLAITLFDAATLRVEETNQAAEAFFGRPAAELHGREPETCFVDEREAAALRASLLLARDVPDGVRREVTRPGPAGALPQRWDTRFVHLAGVGGSGDRGQLLLLANDVTELRQAEQARLDAAISQRERLVKEVHHRIKNNLQGVAGLLQQTAQRRPDVKAELGEAIGQVQAIAQVYGLQVGADGPLDLLDVLSAISGSVQRSTHRVIEVRAVNETGGRWMLPENESIPLALTLNELLTNAVKHGDGGTVRCTCTARADDVLIEIANGGRLADDFDLRRASAGMYGLGLVRALLPRRTATLDLAMRDGWVMTSLVLRPPSVRRAAA